MHATAATDMREMRSLVRSWAASQRERSANRTYCARVDVVRALGQRLVKHHGRDVDQEDAPGREEASGYKCIY